MTRLKINLITNYISQFYITFIGVFMLPFYLKHLGAEAYGLVGFFIMLTSIMLLFDMGFSNALARETAKLKDKENGYLEIKNILRSVETLISILSVIVVLGIYLISYWVAVDWLKVETLSVETTQSCIKLMGLIIGIKWFISLYHGVIIGLEQQVWLNIYKIAISTLKFVGGLLLILYITNDIFYFFVYQAVIALLEFLVLTIKIYSVLPRTDFLKPSINSIKTIAPFALSFAYVSGVWIIYTQLDKLLLSHYIELDKYGYFALVTAVSNAIIQISTPLSQAILPRMTSLLSTGKKKEMLTIYRKGTQLVSIIIFSIVGIISFFSYEFLYSWSGDIEASLWAAPILFWYALGNAILALSAFQYYLQFAYGDLKYYVRFNTYFPIVALPIVFYAVSNFSAIGAAVAWFFIQLVSFILWTPFVHKQFAPGLHGKWIRNDILPALTMTVLYLLVLKLLNLDLHSFSRLEVFIILVVLGSILMFLNIIIYSNNRNKIFNYIKR